MNKNNLKKYRQSKEISQVKLAEILGVSNDYISAIERGVRTPGFKLAKRIADYFGVTVDEIFFENNSNKIFGSEVKKFENQIKA